MSRLHFAPTEISLLACRGIPLAGIRPTEMSVSWTSIIVMTWELQCFLSWLTSFKILGETDRSETVVTDTETVASSFSQRRVLFGCQVFSQVLRIQVQCHFRHSDISLERFVRRATLICRAAENESWQCKSLSLHSTLPCLRPCNSRSVV